MRYIWPCSFLFCILLRAFQIISSNKPRRRPNSRRGAARAQVLGKSATAPATRARVAAAAAATKTGAAAQTVPTNADKIIVSNLPADVNEAQIKELFASTVGPTKEVNLSYDASGRSKGVAAVTFSKKGDANKAYQQYHNRLIDGSQYPFPLVPLHFSPFRLPYRILQPPLT
ncbi:mRNA export protein mlo3 [Leucoagaricus sp. SymC.cos]|nr:mRNA export protein mlo3 [Leucoagaricus sp. SymC.cos]